MKRIKKLSMASSSEALTALRKLHKRYVRACGSRFRSVPFRATAVPGWIYVPKTDTVMPQRQVVHRKVRPTTRRTLRALGGRRVTIEGFGKRSPALFVIAGNAEAPAGAWLSPVELRRFVEAVKRILK